MSRSTDRARWFFFLAMGVVMLHASVTELLASPTAEPPGPNPAPRDPRELRAEVDQCLRAFRGAAEEPKKEALDSLAGLGSDAVPMLLDSVRYLSNEPAVWVVRALRRSADPRSVFPLMTRYSTASLELKEEILATLGRIGEPRTLEFFEIAIEEREPVLRRRAVTALVRLDAPRAARALLRALEDEDWRVRSEAVAGVMSFAERKVSVDVTGWLLSRIDRAPIECRTDLLRVLASFGDARAIGVLGDSLRLDDVEARCLSAHALARIGNRDAVPVLESALYDEDERVRIQVVRSLTEVAGADCHPAILRRMRIEESPRVRYEMRRRLRPFVGRDLGPDPDAWRDWFDTNR